MAQAYRGRPRRSGQHLFVDNSRGWAVGERGRILFYHSGGKLDHPAFRIYGLAKRNHVAVKSGWVVGDKGTLCIR